MIADQLKSDRHALKAEIDVLVQDYKANEQKIDKARLQYGEVLRNYYSSLEYEHLGRLILDDLTEYVLYMTSNLSNMPFMIFDAQAQMLGGLQGLIKQQLPKQNLAVSIAPSTGKSSMIQYAVSWAFLRNPDIACMYLSNKEFRAKDQSARTRDLILSEPWQRIGGVEIDNSKLSGAQSSKLKWKLKSGSTNSGFEAGSHGNILGGSAGNPNTSGFKGALFCFPYDEYVMTNKGKIKIGKIVKNKMNLLVLSRNLETGKNEYQPILRYISNPKEKIIEIGYKGGTIRCTPDHKLFTAEGWKEARNLTVNDILLRSSDVLDLIQTKSCLSHDVRTGVVFIQNKVKNIIRQLTTYMKRFIISNPLCQSCPNFPRLDMKDQCRRNVKVAGHYANRTLVCRNSTNGVFGIFRCCKPVLGKHSYSNRIVNILTSGPVCKIRKIIIQFVPVQMANVHFWRSWAQKRQSHHRVNCFRTSCSPIVNHIKPIIANIINVWAHNTRRIKKLFFWNHPMDQAPNISFIRRLIARISWYLFPNFFHCRVLYIKSCGYNNTYCLTVRSNHNLYVGEKQEILAKNCDDFQSQSVMTSAYDRAMDIETYKGPVKTRRRTVTIPIVVNMQRLHQEDLIGFLEQNESDDYNFIAIPALMCKNGVYYSADPRAYSVEQLLKEQEKNPFQFAAMMQQRPIPAGGQYFYESDFMFYQTLPQFQFTFIATDFAFKKEEKNDRSVFMHLGMGMDNCLYLIDMVAFREDAIGVKQRLIEFTNKARERDPLMTLVVVETSIANTAFIPSIAREYPYLNFVEFRKGGMNNKVQYIKAMREFFLAKKIYFPESPRPQGLIDELLMFTSDGAIGHDDQVDCLAQGVHWVYREMNNNSIFI